MLEAIHSAVAWLNAIDPAVPRALFVGLVFFAVYVIRKLFPRTWELFARAVPVAVIDPAPLLLVLSKTWQALPGAAIGALMTAYSSGGDARASVKGAIFGGLAALAHEVLKAVPWLPYRGEVGKKGPVLPPLSVFWLLGPATLLAALTYAGCSPTVAGRERDIKATIDALRASCLLYGTTRDALPEPLVEADRLCPMLLAPEPAKPEPVYVSAGGASD